MTGVQTKTLIFDFGKLDSEEAAQELKNLLESLKEDISILVNNVGALLYGRLSVQDESKISSMMNVNVNAMTYMS